MARNPMLAGMKAPTVDLTISVGGPGMLPRTRRTAPPASPAGPPRENKDEHEEDKDE